ncbi:MAG: carbonic anhydrase [Candidatus Omnitrophota bacterium]
MKKVSTFLMSLALLGSVCISAIAAPARIVVSAEDARQKMIDGNRRYVEAKMSHPDQTPQRRAEIAGGQHPFMAILSCSDSRLPPEVIFDQGLGDLFVIRLAGNIANDAALGSLEYAAEHVGVKYIMVLGHQRCGAVEAAVEGGEAHGHIGSIVKAIQPALEKAESMPGDIVDNTVRANVAMVVEQLKFSSHILKELTEKGGLVIEGAYYDLDSGEVTILSES